MSRKSICFRQLVMSRNTHFGMDPEGRVAVDVWGKQVPCPVYDEDNWFGHERTQPEVPYVNNLRGPVLSWTEDGQKQRLPF